MLYLHEYKAHLDFIGRIGCFWFPAGFCLALSTTCLLIPESPASIDLGSVFALGGVIYTATAIVATQDKLRANDLIDNLIVSIGLLVVIGLLFGSVLWTTVLFHLPVPLISITGLSFEIVYIWCYRRRIWRVIRSFRRKNR